MVREQNSKKKALSNVQVSFHDAVPITSDNAGKFTLAFSGKKAGDLIFMQEISKKGYELVNEKDLQLLKIASNNRLAEDIILAPVGTVEAAKKKYYGISDKALYNAFEKEKKNLQNALTQAKITQKEYANNLNDLFEQLQYQQKAIDELAETFARINFDDVSEEYAQAFEFFEGGKNRRSLDHFRKSSSYQQNFLSLR